MTHKDIQHVRKMNRYTNIAICMILSLMLFLFAVYFIYESLEVTTKGEWIKGTLDTGLLLKGIFFQVLATLLFMVSNALISMGEYRNY